MRPLCLLPIVVIAAACSSSSPDGGDGGFDAASFLCVDPTQLQAGTATLMLAPDGGQLANTQHIVVGSCEAYMLYWNVGGQYDRDLVTNCAPASVGGSSTARGLPASCLVEAVGAGGIDSTAVTMDCVCCAGGECGLYCHPVSVGDAGGMITCASYSYDFQSSLIGDPRSSPSLCDCSGW